VTLFPSALAFFIPDANKHTKMPNIIKDFQVWTKPFGGEYETGDYETGDYERELPVPLFHSV
jgi:hypothetical protein